jgi:hypothetical protein
MLLVDDAICNRQRATMGEKEIRAIYDETTIRVYQAYSPAIAKPALEAGRFVPPFKLSRMTWIKPSFCWMMYRCGYAGKPGQEMVLGIDITREGFEWALEHSMLSTFRASGHDDSRQWKRALARAPVRIQWDPERNLRLGKIEDVRSIQIGLIGEAVERYVNDWTVRIEDVTPIAKAVRKAVSSGQPHDVPVPSESERVYPISPAIAETIKATAAKPASD